MLWSQNCKAESEAEGEGRREQSREFTGGGVTIEGGTLVLDGMGEGTGIMYPNISESSKHPRSSKRGGSDSLIFPPEYYLCIYVRYTQMSQFSHKCMNN